MTYAIVPKVVLERDCMVAYNDDSFFKGSLVEAIGCVLRAFKGMYHTDYTTYQRTDGAKSGGKIAILGGAGPMGMASIELAVNYAKANTVVVYNYEKSGCRRGNRPGRFRLFAVYPMASI